MPVVGMVLGSFALLAGLFYLRHRERNHIDRDWRTTRDWRGDNCEIRVSGKLGTGDRYLIPEPPKRRYEWKR